MKDARILLLVIGLAAIASVTSADTIISTPTGGADVARKCSLFK